MHTTPTTSRPPEREHLLRRLRTAEERVAKLSAVTASGAWSWPDVSVDSVHVSPDLRVLLELPAGANDLTVEESLALVHPEDVPEIIAEIEPRLKDGGDFSVEYRLGHGDSPRYARSYGEVRTYPDRPPSAMGVTSLITRERTLRHQRDAAREALDEVMARGGVRLWEWPRVEHSTLTFSSAPAADPDGADGYGDLEDPDPRDPWRHYLHPGDRGRFADAVAAGLRAPAKFKVEVRMRLRPGRGYRWQLCRGASSRDGDGDLRMAGSLVDIDDRKRLEDELAATHERLDLVVRGATVGVWDWPDMSQDLIHISAELREFMGYAPEEIEDSMAWIFGIVHPDDLETVKADISAVQAEGGPYSPEFRIRFRDGTYRWIRSAGLISRDAGGPGVHRLTGALVDIHERRAAESALSQANEQLEQFAYLVAHDLGAPMRHVSAFAELLDADYADILDAEGLGFLHTIKQASARAEQMIADLLSYARTGTLQLELVPVDLEAVVASVREELVGGGFADHVSWTIAELPTVRADRKQMRLLFQNLLGNAVKFTRGTADAAVSVEAEEHPSDYAITVRDNGPGFDPDLVEHIFRAFGRGHDDVQFEGTGIGLAHVARIVARHQGSVRAESPPDEGARFEVVLPKGGTDATPEQ